jgi:hypothetical protein
MGTNGGAAITLYFLKGKDEAITYFNDQPVAGSLTMTAVISDKAA